VLLLVPLRVERTGVGRQSTEEIKAIDEERVSVFREYNTDRAEYMRVGARLCGSRHCEGDSEGIQEGGKLGTHDGMRDGGAEGAVLGCWGSA
jgi:hypothetical protein